MRTESDPQYNILPSRKRTQRNCLIRDCFATLKEIQSQVYLLKDESYLRDLKETLNETLEDIVTKLPTDHGIPLLQTPKKTGVSVKEEEKEDMKSDKDVQKDYVDLPQHDYGKKRTLIPEESRKHHLSARAL